MSVRRKYSSLTMLTCLIRGVALRHIESLTQSTIEGPGAVLRHVELPAKGFLIHVVQSATPRFPESADFNARQFYQGVLFGNLDDPLCNTLAGRAAQFVGRWIRDEFDHERFRLYRLRVGHYGRLRCRLPRGFSER